jgi:hypothetical protein
MDRNTLTFSAARLESVDEGDWVYLSGFSRPWWRRALGLPAADVTRIVTGICGDTITYTHPMIWRWRKLKALVTSFVLMHHIRRTMRPSTAPASEGIRDE